MAGPLTEQDLQEITTQLFNLRTAKAEIARAKQAGIDVVEQEAEVVRLIDQLTKIKAAYFPSK